MRTDAASWLYKSISLSPSQRLLFSVSSAITALNDPLRDDAIAVLGETSGFYALNALHKRLLKDENGIKLLKNKPLMNEGTLHLEELRKMKDKSFGREYIKFMDKYGYSPDSRKDVKYVQDEELAYIIQRYRQVHDLWHVLTDLPPTVYGEIALKWFELAQTGLPMTALSSFVGPLRLPLYEKYEMCRIFIPWASRAGRKASFLLAQPYEDLLLQDIDVVREKLRIEKAPLIGLRK